MQSSRLLLEEPIRMVSILEASKPNDFPSMTKIVGTPGPTSRSIEVIEACLNAGMSVARFDFSFGDNEFHQETLENLKIAVKNTKKLCAIMLDTVGPELQVFNKSEKPIMLEVDAFVTLTPNQSREISHEVLPLSYTNIARAVKKGDNIFIGQYLLAGNESNSVWLEVADLKGQDVLCIVKNNATLVGSLFTVHICQVSIDLPTLSDTDKHILATWGVRNNIDFVSLSFTRCAEDVQQTRAYLAKLGDLHQTQIFAKIENKEGLIHFDEILAEADGIILSRGTLGIDLPPEKVFLFQKAAVFKCNMAGKPVVIARVVDSMTENLRPTRAEATDVANAVLDGTDAILLGAETFRGLYPVKAISTVGKICAEAERLYNQAAYFKKAVKYAGEPMSHLESIASSAVHAAIKVKASVIIVFTSSGQAARLIAKYRPTMPVLAVVIPRVKANDLRWNFAGAFQTATAKANLPAFSNFVLASIKSLCRRLKAAILMLPGFSPVSVLNNYPARQFLVARGIFPVLAVPRHPAESSCGTNESMLKMALDHVKGSGMVKPHDRVVVCQKINNSPVLKILEIEE